MRQLVGTVYHQLEKLLDLVVAGACACDEQCGETLCPVGFGLARIGLRRYDCAVVGKALELRGQYPCSKLKGY